ncbi:MAG: hypothetical protein C4519_23275 [Desulfobacteraceae bacterium]|nr:MAG: hypothetical protein C4519_23275 [Desulfobacteraceae bacterium]
MAISWKSRFFSIVMAGTIAFFVAEAFRRPAVVDETFELHGPYFDKTAGTMSLVLRMKPGVEHVHDAQNALTRALDLLSEADSGTHRKILKMAPGHYIFSRPVVFKQYHLGIDLIGVPELTKTLTRKEIEARSIREEITNVRAGLPVIDGDGVTSFLVVDGVAAGAHLTTRISGFYFVQQMAGLGGTHYPDFSYRLEDQRFKENGGYYSRYAFNDGGVVSVLGNSSVTFEDNIVDHPMAYQCGGVVRNEQYGAPGSTSASIVASNIVINPFAWHTGAFVDNNTGSYARVSGNQILIDGDIPHEVDIITNFDGAFLIAEDNRFIDARSDKSTATIGIRLLGRQGAVIIGANTFEGIAKPQEHIPGSPHFPGERSFYFLVKKAKLLKVFKHFMVPGTPPVWPGQWPKEMAALIRTEDLADDDQLRIAALKIHFERMRADLRNRRHG